MVEKEDLHGQARALSTLAGIYEETQQMTKAEDYYKKVSGLLHSEWGAWFLTFITAVCSILSAW